MDEESIRKDKNMARAVLKGLTCYAGQLACQSREDEIRQIRRLVDAISVYWGIDGKRDWTEEFDEKMRLAGQRGTSVSSTSISRLRTVNGLFRYAKEMSIAQGIDEIDRILEIHDIIQRLEKDWEMPSREIDYYCDSIRKTAEQLQAVQHAMEM